MRYRFLRFPLSLLYSLRPNLKSIWTHGSRGTRTHKRGLLVACFQDRFLIRSDGFPNNCGGWNRTSGLVVQSHGFLPAETTPHRKCPAGIEPACPVWKTGASSRSAKGT